MYTNTHTQINTHTHMHACTHAQTASLKFQLEPFQNFEVGAFFCCSTLLFHTHNHALLAVDTDMTQTGVEQWGREGRHSINRRVERAALRQVPLFAGACHLSTHPHSLCVSLSINPTLSPAPLTFNSSPPLTPSVVQVCISLHFSNHSLLPHPVSYTHLTLPTLAVV